jgi:hypothetical protein
VTAVSHLAAVCCHFCSRQLPPFRVYQLGPAECLSQTICDDCLTWHNRAIALLAGEAISGCQGCGASWQTLCDREPGQRVPLYVVPRDGVYQVLCAACLVTYVPKRRDLYGRTAFGAALGM